MADASSQHVRSPAPIEEFVVQAANVVEEWVATGVKRHVGSGGDGLFRRGKMLRSRMTAWLLHRAPSDVATPTLVRLCAAAELVHTGSLCHDDVIDVGLVRRHEPSLWRTTTPNYAILAGDLLYCGALDMLHSNGEPRYASRLVRKVMEMVLGESKQELHYRGRKVDVDTCVELARGKTGPLFSFVASAVAEEGTELYTKLEEVGYRIGTAYQLADDLVDEQCALGESGKTGGTDRKRGKYTLAHNGEYGSVRAAFSTQLRGALDLLAEYPAHRGAVEEYVRHEFMRGIPASVCSILAESVAELPQPA